MEEEVLVHTSQVDGLWITQTVAFKLESSNSIDLVYPVIQVNEIGRSVEVIISSNFVEPGKSKSLKNQSLGYSSLPP